jgi:hypothetical protein
MAVPVKLVIAPHAGIRLMTRYLDRQDWLEFEVDFDQLDDLEEAMAYAAAAAASDEDADAFLRALLPLAARAIPVASPILHRFGPLLAQRLRSAGRVLRQDRQTRPLMRAMPGIILRSSVALARRRAQGKPVTSQVVGRTLQRSAVDYLGNPRRLAAAMTRSYRILPGPNRH